MILFLFLTVTLIIYSREDKEALRFVYFAYFLGLLIYSFKLIEHGFNRIDYFISDEAGYYYQIEGYFFNLEKIDRLFWYALNYFVKKYDFLSHIGIKLINIPITSFGIIWLSRIFKNKIKYQSFILCVPYILVMMTLNLRDCLLLTSACGFVYQLESIKLKNIIFQAVFFIIIYFLRPVTSFVLLIVTILFLFTAKDLRIKNLVYISIFTSFLYLSFQSSFNEKISRYYYYTEYNFSADSKAYDDRVNSKGVADFITSENVISNTLFGALRYLVTPIPTSLLLRISEGGGKFGTTDDLVRVINQILYYYFLGYIFLNIRYLKLTVTMLTPNQLIILSYFFTHLFIYSFISFGGSHQRNKIPFQMFIFIVYALILFYKKHENIKFSKN